MPGGLLTIALPHSVKQDNKLRADVMGGLDEWSKELFSCHQALAALSSGYATCLLQADGASQLSLQCESLAGQVAAKDAIIASMTAAMEVAKEPSPVCSVAAQTGEEQQFLAAPPVVAAGQASTSEGTDVPPALQDATADGGQQIVAAPPVVVEVSCFPKIMKLFL